MQPVIGIISGSGLDDPNIFTEREEKVVQTPFGDVSFIFHFSIFMEILII